MIPYPEFYLKYITPYEDTKHIYRHQVGFIVWRTGTGGNTELLHIRTWDKGKGHGRRLVYHMLDRINPYFSVFGFTRVGNDEAQKFYGTLGFNLQEVSGLYQDGQAIMFWQSYKLLMSGKSKYEDTLHS